MRLKIFCFLLLSLLLILRAGLVFCNDEIENTNSNVTVYTFTDKHESIHTTTKAPSSTASPNINFDKCVESGIIKDCTKKHPYCFIDGDNIGCGPTGKTGWRISPLDGLILNNGQIPNPNCELFTPPKSPEINNLVMDLLYNSAFGSEFQDHKSAWFNIFEYLGNCPVKSKFCDKDVLTCRDLFEVGKNCTSSNQCITRFCEKYDVNSPDSTTERRCVNENDTIPNTTPPIEGNTGKSSNSYEEKNEDEILKNILVVIAISIASTISILGTIIYLIRAQRKKRNQQPTSLLPNNRNHSLRPSVLSRISSSYHRRRDSSDNFSTLLPPPPTLDRDLFYENNNDFNVMNDRNSFNPYV